MASKSTKLLTQDKILMASYVLIVLAYGAMFYIKWKEKVKSK